jgi:hypothetical protein
LKKARNGKRGEENILTVNYANDKNEKTNIQNLLKKKNQVGLGFRFE